MKFNLLSLLTILMFSPIELVSKHIFGAYYEYEVVEVDGVAKLDVMLHMFRDKFGGGADFDNPIFIGVYTDEGGNQLTFNDAITVTHGPILEVSTDPNNPFLIANEEYILQKTTYSFELNLVPDRDYFIIYRRCCRANDIVNIEDVEDTGMTIALELNKETLQNPNKGPKLLNILPAALPVQQSIDFQLRVEDDEGDLVRFELCSPKSGGGPIGTNDMPGNANLCDGITPHPQICKEPLQDITYLPSYSSENQFGGDDPLTIDPTTGNFGGSPPTIGLFSTGFCYTEERNGQILSKTYLDIMTNIQELSISSYVEGKFFFDTNEDGIKQENEKYLSYNDVDISPEPIKASYSQYGFRFNVDIGEYVIEPVVPEHFYITSSTDDFIISIDDYFVAQSIEIGLAPSSSQLSLTHLVDDHPVRCNATNNRHITVYNSGSLIQDVTVEYHIKNPANFFYSNIPYEYVNNEKLRWVIEDLYPFESQVIIVGITYPLEDQDIAEDNVQIFYADANDPNNSEFLSIDLFLDVLCSYDPNDKVADPEGNVLHSLQSEAINYTVRFQNIGNAPAKDIQVIDFLDSKLDLQSFQLIGASHDYEYGFDEEGNLIMDFKNINLPGLSQNPGASTGQFSYRINPIYHEEEFSIFNEAWIYFDFNDPIITNEVATHFKKTSSLNEISQKHHFSVFPNPTSSFLEINQLERSLKSTVYIMDQSGQVLYENEMKESANIDVKDWMTGVYFIKIHSPDSIFHYKFIKL